MQLNDDPECTATTRSDRNQSNQEERGETEDFRQQPESNAFLGEDDLFLDEDDIEKFLQNEEGTTFEGNLRHTRKTKGGTPAKITSHN